MLSENIVYLADFAIRSSSESDSKSKASGSVFSAQDSSSNTVTPDFLVGRHIALTATIHNLVSKRWYPSRGQAFLDVISVSDIFDRKTKWLLENFGVERNDEVVAFFGKLARAHESARNGAVSYLLERFEDMLGHEGMEMWKEPDEGNFELGFAQLALAYTYPSRLTNL
jgi:hypothetical protein